jgi:formate dehydrogenase subunit gamma
MVSRSIIRGTAALAVALSIAIGVASAQSPGVNPNQAAQAAAEQKQRIDQPLNNLPVWKEIRSGEPQITTVRGRETNVLIQPEGQTWRAVRAPIIFWGGMLFALAVAGTVALYLVRGPMGGNYKPGGRLIERFAPADRYAHWLVAIAWATLAGTGLVLSLGKSVLLPLIGYTLFSWLATIAKNLHNFVGPILIVGTPWLIARFIRDNTFTREDVRFFANIVGYFKGQEYPSGRFNAGEKFVPFWLMLVAVTPVLVVTGLILVFPNFDQTRQTMQLSNVIHMIAAYVGIAMLVLHIYLGTVGFSGSYRAMREGYVDENWAEHNHRYWYDDVAAGRSRQHFAGGTEGRPVEQAAARPHAAD